MSVPVPSTNPRRPQLAFPPGPFPGLSEARPRAAGQSGARRRPARALVRGGRIPPVAGEPAEPPLRGSRRWFKGGGGEPARGRFRLPLARVRAAGLRLLRGPAGRDGAALGTAAGRPPAGPRAACPEIPACRGARREGAARRKWSPPGGVGAARRSPSGGGEAGGPEGIPAVAAARSGCWATAPFPEGTKTPRGRKVAGFGGREWSGPGRQSEERHGALGWRSGSSDGFRNGE